MSEDWFQKFFTITIPVSSSFHCSICDEWIEDPDEAHKQHHLDGKCNWFECNDCPNNGDDCTVCNNEGGMR